MRIFIVRHLDESFFSAGITPQGFYDQHSPLTLFRKVEVLTIIYSIALQRQVFVFHFKGWGGSVFRCSGSNLAAMEMTIHAQELPIYKLFLRSNNTNSSFQLDALVGCSVVI